MDVLSDKVKSEGVENEEDNKRNFCYYEDDPTYIPRTIFVKNLPPKTRRKQIKEIFGKCGDILFVRFTNAIPAKSSIPAEAAVKKRSLIKEGTTVCTFIYYNIQASTLISQLIMQSDQAFIVSIK